MSQLEELKSKIKERLSDENGPEVVVGWGMGYDPLHATPLFMKTAEDVDKLVFGPLSVHNTSTYLTGLKGKKVGLVVKGCDSRGVIQLAQEGLINREDVTVFGMPCSGTVDMAKIRRVVGDLDLVEKVETNGTKIKIVAEGNSYDLELKDVAADKCATCRFHNAIEADVFVGDKLPPTVEQDPYDDLAAFEALPLEERFQHWQDEMQRCIRCYACRNACPMCVCRDHCVASSRNPHWVSAADDTREKWMFQLIHAMHLAGRCVECGECQRACPVDIPILKIKRKLNKEFKELFDYEAGIDSKAIPPLMTFEVEEENINERGW